MPADYKIQPKVTLTEAMTNLALLVDRLRARLFGHGKPLPSSLTALR